MLGEHDETATSTRGLEMRTMAHAYLNAVATAVPENEVHDDFKRFARRQIQDRRRILLDRMLKRSGIENRWSTFKAEPAEPDRQLDDEGFYTYGAFPSTGPRMVRYNLYAAQIAERAVRNLQADLDGVTHLLVASCTGMSAPGVDLQLVQRLNLSPSVERTMIGFMGCYAGITALRLARQIVRADPSARVLCASIELCTLHLQETDDLEKILSFSIFGDGSAACLVTSSPTGLRLDEPVTTTMPAAQDLITWDVGDQGFDMVLSGETPAALKEGLPSAAQVIVPEGTHTIDRWAIHPGGRSILDAVAGALGLPDGALDISREVLRAYGNMSSASVLFVLADMLREGLDRNERGVAMAFGPGLTAETIRFSGCA